MAKIGSYVPSSSGSALGFETPCWLW